MSGVEAFAFAASIIQVADLGTKLSVKLFAFYRRVKDANETIQLLSNEVALISAILRELGDNLKEEESAKLCSDEAFRTLECVLDQCRDVLRQIERVVSINDHSGKTRLQQVTGKFRLVLLEPSLDPLKSNLQRLKSTMLLLLNVIMFAGQVRYHNISILQEQRALIETLLQERDGNVNEQSLPKDDQAHQKLKSKTTPISSEANPWQKNGFPEVEEYNVLIRKMLREIDLCKSKLENSRHSRIRKGVLGIHDSEIVRFQLTHGHSVLDHIDTSLLSDGNHISETAGINTANLSALHDNRTDASFSPVSTIIRKQSPGLGGSPTESETSFYAGQMTEPLSNVLTPGANDIAPGQLANLQTSSTGQKSSQRRSATLPMPTGHDSPKIDGHQQYIPGPPPTQYTTNLPPPPPRQPWAPLQSVPPPPPWLSPTGYEASYGLGYSIPGERPTSSPTAVSYPPILRKPLDFEVLDRISSQAMDRPGSPLLSSIKSTLNPSVTKTPSDGSPISTTLLDTGPDLTDLLARHETHLRDVELKVKENWIARAPLPPQQQQQASKVSYGETSYRRQGIIDFDAPGISSPHGRKPPRQEKHVSRCSSSVAPVTSGAFASSKTTWEPSRSMSKSSAEKNSPGSPRPFAAQSASPPNASKSSLSSRKSFGPIFDFEENEVSFARPSQAEDDSDDGSNDGLFAIRPSMTEPEKPEKKPSLTVGTENSKCRSVSFQSLPNSASNGTFSRPSAHSFGGDASDNIDQFSGSSHGAVLPEFERFQRRDSFARDFWISRPPVEGIIDDLESFFPGIDFDAPYLDDPSPKNKTNGENEETLRRESQTLPVPQDVPDPAKAHEIDASTVRLSPGAMTTRKVNHSGGGLSRTRAFREVAKGATHRTKSIGSSAGPQKSGDFMRCKNTKMFGARIMQISPKPGTRISQLDPIPQQASQPDPVETVPQSQQTLRIIRGQLIAKGTYGPEYLGINADNGEVLAVKQVEINAQIAETDRDRIKKMMAALNQEIDTMQHLEHPNIVQFLGCGRGDLSISIYVEYISGDSIGSYLRKHGKFEERVVKSLACQTLGGLAYLHDMGILHGDLSADNILLDIDGTCKISDFGISQKMDDIHGNDFTNSMKGSVSWIAPEIIQSQGQCFSAKVDIWSLGCVVLEMFAGRRPWSKEEAIGAIFKPGSLNQTPPVPDDVSMTISPTALAFLYDCFTVDPSERPSARDLLARHPFCEPDPTFDYHQSGIFAKVQSFWKTGRTETVGAMSDEYRDLDTSNDTLSVKMRPESDDRDRESEVHSHTNSLATETDTTPLNNFEELLLRWTKLGQNEVRALGNPRSHIWASVTTI